MTGTDTFPLIFLRTCQRHFAFFSLLTISHHISIIQFDFWWLLIVIRYCWFDEYWWAHCLTYSYEMLAFAVHFWLLPLSERTKFCPFTFIWSNSNIWNGIPNLCWSFRPSFLFYRYSRTNNFVYEELFSATHKSWHHFD